jgi:DNA repair protein RadC
MNVKLTEAQKIKILNSDDIYGVMQKILLREDKIDRNKEHFWTIGLNNGNSILYIELISIGSSNKTMVEPMQVFRVGVLKGAVKMILVHNHPSGEIKPSGADKDVTDRLVQVGNILQIEVIDHLIIAEKKYTSFNDTGLLDQIRQSKVYLPDYQLKAKLKKEVEEIEQERGAQKRNKEIALQMKQKGYTDKDIAELTGLTQQEVKKLKA